MAYGVTFRWPDTNGGSTATFVCPNEMFVVSRECLAEGRWETFDQRGCGVLASEFMDVSTRSQNVNYEIQSFGCMD